MLLQDVKQFLKGVLRVEKVLQFVKVSETHMKGVRRDVNDASVNPTKFLRELKSWQTTLQQFVIKMESQYPLYKDLLSQFLAGVSEVGESSMSV